MELLILLRPMNQWLPDNVPSKLQGGVTVQHCIGAVHLQPVLLPISFWLQLEPCVLRAGSPPSAGRKLEGMFPPDDSITKILG